MLRWIVTALFLSASVAGCDPQSSLRREIHSLSPEEQWQRIRDEGNHEHQIRIYLIAMEQHPPDFTLATAVAMSGQPVLEPTLEKLERTRLPATIVFLLQILWAMDTESFYCVHCDTEALDKIESVLERMSAGGDKETAASIVDEIRSNRSP